MITTILILLGFAIFAHALLVTSGLLKQDFRRTPVAYLPRVSVIIPCKGADDEFVTFLKSLEKQTYTNADYLFCLANEDDRAISAITLTLKRLPYQIIISKQLENTGEKNQNIIAALEVRDPDAQVIAFLDSDGILDEDYLASLIAPLQDERYVCASTYRRYETDTIGGLITKYWNLVSLSFKQFPSSSWAWAGGCALRCRDLTTLDIPRIWIGALVDDQPLNMAIRRLGLRTFSIDKQVRSDCHHTVRSSIQWITRQSFHAQRYYPPLHFINLLSIAVFLFYLTCALLTSNPLFLAPFAGLFFAIGVLVFKYGTFREGLFLPFIYIMIAFVTLYASIRTPFMRQITWSGIRYTVDKKGRVTRRTVCPRATELEAPSLLHPSLSQPTSLSEQRPLTKEHILVTGGAGFIGSFLVDALVQAGNTVRVLDNLTPQVHPSHTWPEYINDGAEYIQGDVRDPAVLRNALSGVTVVLHHAAAVGVAQSQYDIEHYVSTNITGTAALYQAILDLKMDLKRMIIAGSMSCYGEGSYHCPRCGNVSVELRQASELAASRWDYRCPTCEHPLQPLPTNESHPCRPTSIYAISKKVQEEIAVTMALTYHFPTVVFRYFNVYGPRQALGNPYTGVVAIFVNRLLNGLPPIIYEDGRQLRDFVSVNDVVQANLLALTCRLDGPQVINIGSGSSISVREIAELVAAGVGSKATPELPGKFRVGDIRHCFADITKARTMLGFEPKYDLRGALSEIVEWARPRRSDDRVNKMLAESEAAHVIR